MSLNTNLFAIHRTEALCRIYSRYLVMNQLTDEELVLTYITTQQNEHFALLYKRYYQKVYLSCIRFAGAGVEAEDLTHDVFERVLHKLDTFKGGSRFSTWLFAVCRNYCLTQHQHQQQRNWATTVFEQANDSILLPDSGCSLEQQLTLLERAIQDLSDDDRQILLARYETNATINQLVTATQASPSAVKMRLWRVRERLRRALR